MAALPPVSEREILARRGPRRELDAARPYDCFVEPERTRDGAVEDVATIFLTNKECPFRCLFCDLWQSTTPERVPDGAVAQQVAWALEALPPAPHVKLYNAGSFFDDQAVAEGDRARIAQLVRGLASVIVECHPKLVDERCAAFARAIAPARLEVAMGLETVDPELLPRIKPSMTLADFDAAARFLTARGIEVRAFVLLGPPGHRGAARAAWARRALDHAFSLGVSCCVVIPVRPGNGSVDALARDGHFERSTLAELEDVVAYGLRLGRGRVFADLWDIERLFDCPDCGPARTAALARANLAQKAEPPPACACRGRS